MVVFECTPGIYHYQRNHVLDKVEKAIISTTQSSHPNGHKNSGVNVWWFDDMLVNRDGSVFGRDRYYNPWLHLFPTSLTMDAFLRFRPMAMHFVSIHCHENCSCKLTVFSPNIKQEMVQHLNKLSAWPFHTVVSGMGCACNFNYQWFNTRARIVSRIRLARNEMRERGGLDVTRVVFFR